MKDFIKYKRIDYTHRQFFILLNELLKTGYRIYFYKNENKDIICEMEFPFGDYLEEIICEGTSMWKSLKSCMEKRQEFIDDYDDFVDSRHE